MKTLIFSSAPERFKRCFARTVPQPSAKNKSRLWDEDSFFGTLRGDHFCLYFRKRRRFGLFSCRMHGTLCSEGEKCTLRYYFARPLAMEILFGAWLLLLAVTAFILRDELFFVFVCGALFCIGALPFLVFTKNEKRRLLDKLHALDSPHRE